ncbi:MAG: hypothetical protein V4547_17825 [Bacteroidota bacterium]
MKQSDWLLVSVGSGIATLSALQFIPDSKILGVDKKYIQLAAALSLGISSVMLFTSTLKGK